MLKVLRFIAFLAAAGVWIIAAHTSALMPPGSIPLFTPYLFYLLAILLGWVGELQLFQKD